MSLRGKILVMLVGPSAMGKSTIMNEAVRLDPEFSRVRSFTTRQPRSNDEPHQYFYLTPDEVAAKRQAGEIVSEVIFPTTNQTYGTLHESYTGTYCLLDTLSNSVAEYRDLDFADTITISLTTTLGRWREWFLMRYPEANTEAMRRLEEAAISINWSLSDPETLWLINDDTPETIAKKLIAISRGAQPTDDGREMARAILDLIEKGAVYA